MKCNCGELMELTEEDTRQEWREETYSCKCGEIVTHRTEFDQRGLVISDKMIEGHE